MHAYLIFVKERKTTLLKQYPGLEFKAMMQLVAQKWKDMPADERAYFDRKAEIDKQRNLE